MNSLEFYFDYRSPYSYLAHSQLGQLATSVVLRPFDIADLMKRVGNVPTSVLCAAKNRYLQHDLKRWAALYHVPLRRHPAANTVDSRRLLRATLAADQLGEMARAAAAIYRAYWCEHAPLDSSAQIAAVFGEAGLDGAAIEALIDDPSQDESLNRATSLAVERGVFGAPTFFVGDDMYFGNDRLDFVRGRVEAGA